MCPLNILKTFMNQWRCVLKYQGNNHHTRGLECAGWHHCQDFGASRRLDCDETYHKAHDTLCQTILCITSYWKMSTHQALNSTNSIPNTNVSGVNLTRTISMLLNQTFEEKRAVPCRNVETSWNDRNKFKMPSMWQCKHSRQCWVPSQQWPAYGEDLWPENL